MYIMAGAQAVKFFKTPREMCEDVDSLLTSSPSSALVRHLRRWFSPLLHWRRARIGPRWQCCHCHNPTGCTATAATATFACESAFSFAFFSHRLFLGMQQLHHQVRLLLLRSHRRRIHLRRKILRRQPIHATGLLLPANGSIHHGS